ncbi:MAG: hypothetical protein IT236_05530 [Bacteroidia bacterium]|nr:hypothetical protein [Bacteroidia bacterium]
MKMKRVTLGFSVLALTVIFAIACKKPTPNVVPEPDTEVQTAVDASWATFVVSDIETMCSFMGENNFLTHFYSEVPGTATGLQGTMTVTRDTNGRTLNMGFFKTSCIDGRFREGTVFMRYGGFSADEIKAFIPRNKIDSRYTHSYGFGGFITLTDYKVDGWRIETVDGVPAVLTNEMLDDKFDPAKSPLKWKLKGKFKFIHPTDSTMNMLWDGEIIKTVNSTTTSVWYATSTHVKDSAIKWKNSKISYSGTISGVTSKYHPFTMTISDATPLTRDFKCYPYMVGGVVLGTGTTTAVGIRKQEYHPFTSGIAAFITADDKGVKAYPREIYYGNEGASVEGVTTDQCDNTAEVYIKGITYRINLLQ